MAIQIKQVLLSDVELYKTIRLESLREDQQAFGQSYEKEKNLSENEWRERIGNPDNCILVAKDGETPVGMIGYHLKNEGNDAHLWGMFVSKTYRGEGIGKKLMEQIIQKAKEVNGVKKISLDVNPQQTAAVGLYKKLGFKKVGTRLYLMGDGVERGLLTMEMKLG